jgi:hypothetical protein
LRVRFGEGRVIWRETEVQWQEAWRMPASLFVPEGSGLERGEEGRKKGESPPSLVSSTCWWCHSLGIVDSGASVMTPVATSHSQSSGGEDGEGCLARRTWQPQIEQKCLVEVGDVE